MINTVAIHRQKIESVQSMELTGYGSLICYARQVKWKIFCYYQTFPYTVYRIDCFTIELFISINLILQYRLIASLPEPIISINL
jgi:hypothetical protein